MVITYNRRVWINQVRLTNPACVQLNRENEVNTRHVTLTAEQKRDIDRSVTCDACSILLGATQVSDRLVLVQGSFGSSTIRPIGVASENIRFPVL